MQRSPGLREGIVASLLYVGRRLWARWWTRKQPEAPPERAKISHFVTGQVVVLAEHAPDLAPQEIVERIQQQIAKLRDSADERIRGSIELLIRALRELTADRGERASPVLTVERTNGRPFSICFAGTLPDMDDARLIAMLDVLNRGIIAGAAADDRLALQVVSPNWLGSCAPAVGWGGPGAQPVATSIAPVWTSSPLDAAGAPWGFDLPASLDLAAAEEAVDVALLDTATPAAEIERAFQTWAKHHPLIRSLLGPDGTLASNPTLEVTYAIDAGIELPGDVVIHGHDYTMYDHGLFAAGIIHTIAPRARLHLIEVLNHQGIGTLETIARGLEMLVKTHQSRPLIVNCSLMVDVPLLGQPRRNLKWDLLATDCELMKRMGWPLEWICDELGVTSGMVVAAAGNDGAAGQRPGARYLAAFGSVLGVGALNHDRSPAEYSNFSDTPVRSGIATFGGNAVAGVADPDHGALGIYTAAFPPSHAGSTPLPTPQLNTTGWARWAGTSFATPVVSGVLAALCGQGKTPEDARQILQAATVTMSAIGSDLPVRQGP